MILRDIIKPGLVEYSPEINSKKQVLHYISDLLSKQTPWIKNKDIFQSFLARERIGSTAIGHGVAIPHCRVEDLKNPIGCLITLENDIDFNSADKTPVNIVFALMVPEENHEIHLKLLAEIAKLLDNGDIRQKLIDAKDPDVLLNLINQQ